MRICLAYDCLFPWTVGGGERWYRGLAERLVAEGHDVTYVTRLQWDPADPPQIPGVRVIAVSPDEPLYGPDGNRLIGEPLRYGRGVLMHLLRHGRDYDIVHLSSFPYFSLLAAGLVQPLARYRLVVDWFEVWSWDYWRHYLGGGRGLVGYVVQRLCARVPQRALCFSALHERRLVALGVRGKPSVVGGLYDGPLTPPTPSVAQPMIVFAGRLIAEKNAPVAVAAIARVRARGLDVHGRIFGQGPDHAAVLSAIADHGLEGIVNAPGFGDEDDLRESMRSALCLLHPSSREGYGIVVIESTSYGTPVVVAAGEDNASVELIEADVNGVVARSADPEDLADAILAVHAGGYSLRERTAGWFAENAERLSLNRSLETVVSAAYGEPTARS